MDRAGNVTDSIFQRIRIALCLGALACLPTACHRPAAPLHLHSQAMGTTWSVTLLSLEQPHTPESVQRAIASLLENLEAEMSHWRPESPLSRFNRQRSTLPFPVPQSTAVVCQKAVEVWSWSDGAFDITCSPLVDLWGFGPSGSRPTPPTQNALATALARVGSQHLMVEQTAAGEFALRKNLADLELDLSALAKGYAIDRVVALLQDFGATSGLVEFGGEVRVWGHGPNGKPWTIGLEQPDPASLGKVRRALSLTDQAVATSGTYRRFRPSESPQRPASHLIDPRTGRPIAHDLVSVSVVAATAMEADALATALMVLGPETGFRLAERRGWAATFVSVDATGRWLEQSTPNFPD